MDNKCIVKENFVGDNISDLLKWRCEPQTWFLDKESSQLVFISDEKTDYWQNTHYGFRADNGHFLYAKTNSNFRMTTKVHALPNNKYDQAGLMIRFSEDVWVKTSIEYIPGGASKLGAVVTNRGYSDWSTQYVDDKDIELYYRISKIGQNCYVDFSRDGESWNQIRIAHLDYPVDEEILAGIYACSPQGKGQEARFNFVKIEELGDDPAVAYL